MLLLRGQPEGRSESIVASAGSRGLMPVQTLRTDDPLGQWCHTAECDEEADFVLPFESAMVLVCLGCAQQLKHELNQAFMSIGQ